MAKFHINNAGEAGACSARAGNCPFAADAEHFGSPEDARTAFEATQGGSFTANKVSSVERYTVRVTQEGSSAVRKLGSYDTAEEAFQAMEAMGVHFLGEKREVVRRKATVVSTNYAEEEVITPGALSVPKAPANPPSKTSANVSWENFETPDPSDSKVIKAAKANDPTGGYMGGGKWMGGKVPDQGYLNQTEAAKGVRDDIREAKARGELPKDLHYSVRKASGAWVTGIDIIVGMKDENGKAAEVNDDDAQGTSLQRVKKYLNALGNQYSTDESNAQFDYFNSNNRPSVKFRNKWS